MEKIILIGFGGHAKSVIDSIEISSKYSIIGYTDVKNKQTYRGYNWLGTDDVLEQYYNKGVTKAVISIGYVGVESAQKRIYENVKKIGFQLPVIIDPSAIVSSDVVIEEGSFIGKRSVVNSESKVGKMCIINTGAILEHENMIGDFSHISVGAILCGNVHVGRRCFIGANTTVVQNISIGDKTIIGAASTVLSDVASCQKVYGLVKNNG